MLRWRRKAIPRSDSPWQPSNSGKRERSRRGNAEPRDDRWLAGPTWLYVAAAVVIFAAAAIVAVIQASGSNEPASASQAAASEQAEQAAQAEQSDAAAADEQQQREDQAAVDQPLQHAQQAQPEQQAAAEPPLEDTDAEAAPTQVIQPEDDPLRGFIVPLAGACITEFEGHLPSAPRAYRDHGIHEGLDFYQWASCVTISTDTAVFAAKAGVVIRADIDYIDITPDDWARFQQDWDAPGVLDEARGRQVWIDHGRGIVTRYAHLSAITDGIAVGVEVEQGRRIGSVGESGQQEVYLNPGSDLHLHFEIRIGQSWLGEGRSPADGRLLYLQAFGLAE